MVFHVFKSFIRNSDIGYFIYSLQCNETKREKKFKKEMSQSNPIILDLFGTEEGWVGGDQENCP